MNEKERRTTITRMILEKLAEAGENTLDIIFPSFRGNGSRRFKSVLSPFDTYPRRVSRRTFEVLLSRLKKQGLIERVGRGSVTKWRLTREGRQRVAQTRKHGPLPRKDGVGRLVIFDIPETERQKRKAVRVELVAADFRQLQKSVWIGYGPLPEDFFALLEMLNIVHRVHIVSIRDQGTIGKI